MTEQEQNLFKDLRRDDTQNVYLVKSNSVSTTTRRGTTTKFAFHDLSGSPAGKRTLLVSCHQKNCLCVQKKRSQCLSHNCVGKGEKFPHLSQFIFALTDQESFLWGKRSTCTSTSFQRGNKKKPLPCGARNINLIQCVKMWENGDSYYTTPTLAPLIAAREKGEKNLP